MKFKNKITEVLRDYLHFDLRQRLNSLENFAQDKFGKGLYITRTISTFAEQKRINDECLIKDPNYKVSFPSVHNYGNGADVSIYDDTGLKWPSKTIQEFADWFNKQYPYNHGDIKSALFHMGTGLHLHLQLNMREFGKGFDQDDPERAKILHELIQKYTVKK